MPVPEGPVLEVPIVVMCTGFYNEYIKLLTPKILDVTIQIMTINKKIKFKTAINIFSSLSLLLSIFLFPFLCRARQSAPEYIESTAKYINNICPEKTLYFDCSHTDISVTCQNKLLNNDPEKIIVYLENYELTHNASISDEIILACITNGNASALTYSYLKYLWNNTPIEYPTEINNYQAQTSGNNSPAVAGNGNQVSVTYNTFAWGAAAGSVGGTILTVFLSLIGCRKYKKKKHI